MDLFKIIIASAGITMNYDYLWLLLLSPICYFLLVLLSSISNGKISKNTDFDEISNIVITEHKNFRTNKTFTISITSVFHIFAYGACFFCFYKFYINNYFSNCFEILVGCLTMTMLPFYLVYSVLKLLRYILIQKKHR